MANPCCEFGCLLEDHDARLVCMRDCDRCPEVPCKPRTERQLRLGEKP